MQLSNRTLLQNGGKWCAPSPTRRGGSPVCAPGRRTRAAGGRPSTCLSFWMMLPCHGCVRLRFRVQTCGVSECTKCVFKGFLKISNGFGGTLSFGGFSVSLVRRVMPLLSNGTFTSIRIILCSMTVMLSTKCSIA